MARAIRTAAGALLCFLWMGWAIGCSGKTDSAPTTEPSVGAQRQTLGTPVTVTLSAPNPLSPIAPVLEASNSISLGAGANIVSGTIVAMGSGGGGVHAEPDALLNDTWSRGTADLRDRVHVRGTLHAKTLTPGNNLVITSRDLTPRFDPPSVLSWNVTYPSSTPGSAVTLFSGTPPQSIPPGQYGAVTVYSRETLTLHAGTYYLTSLDVEPQATISLDQAKGPVIIYVQTGSLILRGAFVPLGGGSPDLVVGYLGQSPVIVESLFDGALIAPFTSITLRALTGVHTGFFAAKDLLPDAHANVQYRAPLGIIKAATPGSGCLQLVTAVSPPASLAQNIARFCNDCPRLEDTDRDGVQNCIDGCPYDPLKTSPGLCGCGRVETDTDGDGVPDCIDLCPNDPNNTSMGECGCVGQPGLAPAGAPCTDTACPQNGATCNGAGVCGNRAACTPATGCKLITWRETSYWFCGVFPSGAVDAGTPPPGQLSQSAALAACNSKGLPLARVDVVSQNRFISHLLKSPIWFGANDITASGVWRWSTPGSNNGDQFWSGGATGSAVNNLFSRWGQGAPGSQRCAVIGPDQLWLDADCSEPLGYVCEFRLPFVRPDGGGFSPPSGMPAQGPAAGPCVSQQEAGLPDDAAVLQQQIAQAGHDVFVGAAASPPPPDSSCPDDPDADGIGRRPDAGEGCAFTNVIRPNGGDCVTNSDCAQFGLGFTCRQIKDDLNCNPPDAGFAPNGPVDGSTCRGHTACGKLVCPTVIQRCNQIEVCGPNPVVDASAPDPGSNLDAEAVNPNALFDAGTDAAPSAEYTDPAIRGATPKDHSWCFMNPQNQSSVPPGVQPSKNKGGTSGRNSKLITFGFDPDLVFDVNPKAIALGQSNPEIHAQAKLVASVALNNFLGQSYSTNIVDVVAGIVAKRCTVSDTETHFRVFGLDVVDPSDLDLFDTSDPSSPFGSEVADLTNQCNDAIAKFVLWANRAKKAFRDGQQLLSQFHSLRSAGNFLSGDLCQEIGIIAADVPGFPGGNVCPPREPVERTINRFIDYYQLPGSGQIAQLEQVTQGLHDISGKIAQKLQTKINLLSFNGINQEESQTIVNVPFAIGPVPMVLQVDLFAKYGIAGNFTLDLHFGDFLGLDKDPKNDPSKPNNGSPPPDPIAELRAGVMPHASAGLSAFVGAGADLGAFSATVGIEGAVTLGDVKAPIYASAGLEMLTTRDFRPLPSDIQPPVSLLTNNFQFSIPKAAKFFITYGYGAGVDVTNVMNGAINAKLRIAFFFFSRTWRKNVVKFNGWSFHFDLVKGGTNPDVHTPPQPQPVTAPIPDTPGGQPNNAAASTTISEGESQMGLSEDQTPLTTLAYLTVPGGDLVPGSSDPTGLSEGFPGSGVLAAPGDDAGVDAQVVTFDASAVQGLFYDDLCCSKNSESCSISGNPHCCPGLGCIHPAGAARDVGACQPVCRNRNEKCNADSDCCPPDGGPALVCGQLKTCVAPPPVIQCAQEGAACPGGVGCCPGLLCNGDTSLCFQPCANLQQSCTSNNNCCNPLQNVCSTLDGSANKCCALQNSPCTTFQDCCGGVPPGMQGLGCDKTGDAQTGLCHLQIP